MARPADPADADPAARLLRNVRSLVPAELHRLYERIRGLRIDPTKRTVTRNGDNVATTFVEFEILKFRTMAVDAEDNVWITAAGTSTVTKLSPEGKVLLTLGKAGGNPSNEVTDPASFFSSHQWVPIAAGSALMWANLSTFSLVLAPETVAAKIAATTRPDKPVGKCRVMKSGKTRSPPVNGKAVEAALAYAGSLNG